MSFLTKRSIRVFHACMTTTIAFVYSIYIESFASPIEDTILKEGIMSINTYSLFATSVFIGAGIGSLIAGPINEWLGIKTSLIIFSQLGTLGAMLLVLAQDSVTMIVGRFLIGISISICVAGVPLYTAEVAQESMRKFYGGILGLAFRFGNLLSFFLGIWLGYRWLAVTYIIMVVFINLNLIFLPESPKWLRNKGWSKKAKEANEYLYGSPDESHTLITSELVIESDNECAVTTGMVSVNSNIIQSEILSHNTSPLHNSDTFTNASLSGKISSYLEWPVIRPLLVCISIQMFKSCSGNEYLVVYSAHTMAKAVSINPRIAAFFYPISLVIGSFIYLGIIHRVQWKKLLLVTTFVQVIANGMTSLTLYLSIQRYHCTDNTQDTILCHILRLIPILLISIYGLSFSMGWGSLIWWLYGHILHSRYTNVSTGIANSSLFLFIVINQLIGPIITENFGGHILFLTMAIITFIGFLIQLLY